MEKSCRKRAPKASRTPLFNSGEKPKTATVYQKFFSQYNILKEDYQKAFKNSPLFFVSNSVPFNGQFYRKQKSPVASEQSLFRLQNKFRKIPLLVIYYLTKFDDII